MNFCVYFDSNYLDRALVCRYTLLKTRPNAYLYTLCFDDTAYKTMDGLENTIAISMPEIEEYCPELLLVKENRQRKEYYATMSPILPLFLFERFGMEKLFYTDADMAFWSDPAEIDEVFDTNSIMACDHGFEPPRRNVRFNVGILAYRNDSNCLKFLKWWKARCIEWCQWVTMPDGRMADQGWLNILHNDPDRFRGFLSCPHPGINLAPWNAWRHTLSSGTDGSVMVDKQQRLICYHYHEFRMIGHNNYHPTGWKLPNLAKELVYDPYFLLIRKAREDCL